MKKFFIISCLLIILATLQGCASESRLNQPNQTNPPSNSVVDQVFKPFTFSKKISSQDLDSKLLTLYDKINKKSTVIGKEYSLTAHIADKYLMFISSLEDYYNRRLSDAEIRDKYRELKSTAEDNFLVRVKIVGTGESLSYSPTDGMLSIYVNKDHEYFVLENEKGEYIKASKIVESAETYVIDVLSSNSIEPEYFTLEFPKKDVEELIKKSQHIYLTFKGVKIMTNPEFNKVELSKSHLPEYNEVFPELETMIQAMEK